MHKCGTALIAVKCLQFAVSLHVCFYAGRRFSSKAAQLTTEWLLPTVFKEVSLEAMGPCAGV